MLWHETVCRAQLQNHRIRCLLLRQPACPAARSLIEVRKAIALGKPVAFVVAGHACEPFRLTHLSDFDRKEMRQLLLEVLTPEQPSAPSGCAAWASGSSTSPFVWCEPWIFSRLRT